MDVSTALAVTSADEILHIARQPDDLPHGWTVVTLNRQRVVRSIWEWAGGTAVGVVFFALLWIAVRGIQLSIVSAILFAVFAFLAVGSAWLVVKYARLLADADRHLIVMTPETLVLQRGDKITLVPMEAIIHLTLRGVFGGDPSYSQVDDRDVRHAVMGFNLFGNFGGGSRRARRTPESLAFVDSRTEAVVVVADDNSFAELPVLEELLRNYIENAQRTRKH
jgi:hypothetical protein